MTNVLLENVELWLSLEQIQWSTLKDELVEFQKTYGSQSMHLCNMSNIGIESWLARSDQVHNNELRKKLYLLFNGKINTSTLDVQDIRGSLEFIVAQIVMSDLISHSVSSPVLDWDDSKGMYERLYSMRWDDFGAEISMQQETRKLLNYVVPDLKPDNIDQVIRFVCDNKSVQSLRSMLLELIGNGETVSGDQMAKYLHEILAADIALQKKSSTFQFFGSIAGLFAGTWYQGAALSGVTSATDKFLFRRDRKYDWYYTLQKKN